MLGRKLKLLALRQEILERHLRIEAALDRRRVRLGQWARELKERERQLARRQADVDVLEDRE